MEFAPTAESAFMPVPTAAVKAWPAPIESATAVEAMEPRTSAYKRASDKIVWAVVAVGCACVWSVPIITVVTDWSRTHVGWPKSNTHSDPNLRVGCPCHNHAKPEQNSIL
jgi:hypothetical protein